ncbi:NAD-dependent epimerase/dehydratase family protein [Meridianimarinicoccus sp. RP-17]|uniref:NAD-dependent epimerase/dehydratase family protein n=1 Tax=Meridianimarinicoccus zhengii TaxID=2056810 RepID=UPI000DAC845C|nr:NAD(P)-dependent oxidoreductase [Phycocomes zhengii]
MRLLLTGASGYLGQFIAARTKAAGFSVTALGRRDPGLDGFIPYDLGAAPPALPPADGLVHAAFDHVPGRYRGGEGDDPAGFIARNRDGSARLFDAAQAAGIPRVVFLSSRAVYGPYPPGTALTENMAPMPDTLYGRMKADVEADLAARAGPGFTPVSLRITGVYGQPAPGAAHKWADLLADFVAGGPIPPRRGTEVHGDCMAEAVRLALTLPPDRVAGRVFNVSDLDLDRRELLALYANLHGLNRPLPDPAPDAPNAMDCTALHALGWRPGGMERLRATLAALPPMAPRS